MVKWQITGLAHAGITVKDINKSIHFYTRILGLELQKLQTNTANYTHQLVNTPGLEKIELAFVKLPDGSLIELLEYIGAPTFPGITRTCDYGTGHICLKVTGLKLMYDMLASNGVEFVSDEVIEITEGKHKGKKAVYMRDPDGYVIELMEGK